MADTRTLSQRLGDLWRSYWAPPLTSRDPALAAYFGVAPTGSGAVVTEATALNYSAVWAAVNRISGSIASLPLIHYKRGPDRSREAYDDSKLYPLLHDAFNEEMSAMTARQTMQAHVLTWGNAYAEIVRNGAGQVVALWPIEPNRVQPYRETPSSPLRYRVAIQSGTQVTVDQERMFHIKGLSFDGIQGYSVIAKARESIGAGLASDSFTSAFMRNGVVFSGFFEHPKTLGETAHQHLRESISAQHQGMQNAGGFRILEEGMTFKPGSMPLKDAEFLETRKFQTSEVARWFNIPPHMLGDLERATFSNIEQLSLEFVMYTLGPWLTQWEQEILRKLIPPLERKQQFAEHLVDGLLRGDNQARWDAYVKGVNSGILKINEARRKENLPPVPGGDDLLIQGAMVPLGRVDDVIDAQVRPTPAPVTPAKAEPPAEDDRAASVERLLADLKAEMQAQNPQEALGRILAGQAAQDPQAETERVLKALGALPAPVVPPPPILDTIGFEAKLADLRTELLAAQAAMAATLTARLATDEALRGWQDATMAHVTARLVRRELAQVKKLGADPERASGKLAAFYDRFRPDALTELRPWLARVGADERAVATLLDEWTAQARTQVESALLTTTVPDLLRRWEIERPPLLCRRVTEVLHGQPVG